MSDFGRRPLRSPWLWGLILFCLPGLVWWAFLHGVVLPQARPAPNPYYVFQFPGAPGWGAPQAERRVGPDGMVLERPGGSLEAYVLWMAPADGLYDLRLICDDHGQLALDGRVLMTQAAVSDAGQVTTAVARLSAGPHLVRLTLRNREGRGGLTWLIRPPGAGAYAPPAPESLRLVDLGNVGPWWRGLDWLGRALWALAGCCWLLGLWRLWRGLGGRWRRPAEWSLAARVAAATLGLVLAAHLALYYGGLGRFPTQVRWDGFSWYAYLPAFLIQGDFSMHGLVHLAHQYGYLPPDVHALGFPHNAIVPMPSGFHVDHAPLGGAILWLPFFLLGHYTTVLLGWAADGFGPAYQFWVGLAVPLYVALGMGALARVLGRWHRPPAIWLTLGCLLLGTNLLDYAANEVTYSHGLSFALISLFLYHFLAWWERPAWGRTLALGALVGLIAMVRSYNVLVVLHFGLYGLGPGHWLVARARFLWGRRGRVLAMLGAFLVAFFPQMLLWKVATDHWIFGTHTIQPVQPVFRWLEPQWGAVLWEMSGWLFWSPLVLLALLGMCLMPRASRRLLAPGLAGLGLVVYIVACFWDPTMGYSYGHRALVDWLPVLAAPLAGFWAAALTGPAPARWGSWGLAAGLVAINLKYMLDYWRGLLPGRAAELRWEWLWALWS